MCIWRISHGSERIALDWIDLSRSRPDATVLVKGLRSSVNEAAYANARLASILDADDMFPYGDALRRREGVPHPRDRRAGVMSRSLSATSELYGHARQFVVTDTANRDDVVMAEHLPSKNRRNVSGIGIPAGL